MTSVRNAQLLPKSPFAFVLALIVLAFTPSLQAAVQGQIITHNTPGFAKAAKSLGPQSPSTKIGISLWLHLHNQPALEALAHQLYDPKSPNYRHWLKSSDLASRFAPTSDEVATVKEFLLKHNFKVSHVGPNNLFVHAEGTVADAQKAFSVHINRFQVDGEERFANTTDPSIEGPAGALVSAVYGLDSGKYKHDHVTASDARSFTKKKVGSAATATPGNYGKVYASNCFPGATSQFFTTGGSLPAATYKGNTYGAPVSGGGPGSLPPCGYSPQDLYGAYNLTGLYAEGYHGEGQTIVIIDWCGSPYIQQDLNVFDSLNGLPPLTINIFNVPTPSNCAGIDPEINIDVEWAHAIAPGAGIDLVVPPSASFADVDEATTYAINYGLGNVISGSYGAPEAFVSPTVLNQENVISLLASVSGISTNYSTGDYGDFSVIFGINTVNAPSDSPYATAVGGVSLALKKNKTLKFQTGWGTNLTGLIAPTFLGNYVADPPINFGFNFGSGGGPSGFFPKPFYQNALPGSWRQQPDISWLADPFTGGEIVLFDGTGEAVAVYGGTSLACPMFSALWAIANQEAGVPLGQAAPYLYSMPSSAITDVLPFSSTQNLKGMIIDAAGTTHYSAAALAAPLYGTTSFYSALYNSPFDGEWDAITFGTDSSLLTTPGWDNVTGLGTPNAQAFADYFHP